VPPFFIVDNSRLRSLTGLIIGPILWGTSILRSALNIRKVILGRAEHNDGGEGLARTVAPDNGWTTLAELPTWSGTTLLSWP